VFWTQAWAQVLFLIILVCNFHRTTFDIENSLGGALNSNLNLNFFFCVGFIELLLTLRVAWWAWRTQAQTWVWKMDSSLNLISCFLLICARTIKLFLVARVVWLGLKNPSSSLLGSQKRTRGENMVKCIQFNHLCSQLVKLTRSRIKIHHKIIIHFFFT